MRIGEDHVMAGLGQRDVSRGHESIVGKRACIQLILYVIRHRHPLFVNHGTKRTKLRAQAQIVPTIVELQKLDAGMGRRALYAGAVVVGTKRVQREQAAAGADFDDPAAGRDAFVRAAGAANVALRPADRQVDPVETQLRLNLGTVAAAGRIEPGVIEHQMMARWNADVAAGQAVCRGVHSDRRVPVVQEVGGRDQVGPGRLGEDRDIARVGNARLCHGQKSHKRQPDCGNVEKS